MKTPVFVSFCLMVVAVIVSTHAFFKDAFSPTDRLKEQLDVVERDRREADLRARLLASELAEYQQNVATLLPSALQGKDGAAAYPLRQLASIAVDGGEKLQIERASSLFENAKGAFREKDFERSNSMFTSLISRFPASLHVAEAHFLLAEGQFQLKEYGPSAATIEKMISQYPENDLTGFALLRLGHIFESQNRIEDAGDIYRAVITNFKEPTIVKQAKASLKAVAL